MFADYFTLKLGDTTVKGRRLTIKEMRSNWHALMNGGIDVDTAVKLIRDHVTLENGKAFDPEELTNSQFSNLIAELTLPKEGRGISDFIGLLCQGAEQPE